MSAGGSSRGSEVKGLWFVCLRDWLEKNESPPVRAQFAAALSPEHRRAFADPLISEWYPEAMLAEALHAALEVVARGDRQRFLVLMEDCTEIGVSRFFRLLLRISTVSFVAKLVPTMWRQIRRGAGTVEVEAGERDALIRYSEFPPFRDPVYELMTVGSLRALVRISTGKAPVVEVVSRSESGLLVRIETRG